MTMLIVGSTENRKYFAEDDDPDMPPLISESGSQNKYVTEFTKYKEQLFRIVKENINYTSVDPAYYTHQKEDSTIDDDMRYKGHIKSYLYELPDTTKYDHIFITSCYQKFFEENIEKLKTLIKSNGIISMIKGVPYYSFAELFETQFYTIYNEGKISMYKSKK